MLLTRSDGATFLNTLCPSDRCHVGGDVPREKEQKAYTFSQTLRSQIRGLNIVAVRDLFVVVLPWHPHIRSPARWNNLYQNDYMSFRSSFEYGCSRRASLIDTRFCRLARCVRYRDAAPGRQFCSLQHLNIFAVTLL